MNGIPKDALYWQERATEHMQETQRLLGELAEARAEIVQLEAERDRLHSEVMDLRPYEVQPKRRPRDPDREGGRTGREAIPVPTLGARVRHRATGRHGIVIAQCYPEYHPDPPPSRCTIAFEDGSFGGPYTREELEPVPPPQKTKPNHHPLDHQDRLAP